MLRLLGKSTHALRSMAINSLADARKAWPRRLTTMCLLVGFAGALSWTFASSRTGLLPECLVHRVTGIYCPGCGAVRAVWDVLHGDFASAARSHLLVVSLGPIWIAGSGMWLARRWSGREVSLAEAKTCIAIVVLTFSLFLLFTIVRNQGWATWLQPL